jgi:diguanylate cyclase (GGDEF)-like protein
VTTAPKVPVPVTRVPARFEPAVEAQFRERGTAALIAVNLNTFWSIAIILLGFGLWDVFVDPAHWRSAFGVRVLGAAIVVATGLFQQLPGQSHWMPLLAKVRLVTAVVASAVAATLLEGGYGFGVAGLIVIILTGPYIAIDGRDLLMTNLAVMAALVPVMFTVSLTSFNVIGTVVFVLLAVAVSTLLGRILEISNRRAFALELELQRDARTDSLTGLANRRAMQESGRVELKRAKRAGSPVSVLLCDLDHFKGINDRYGHEAGDAALVQVAGVLRGALRESDALGRWGGEEFIAVLPQTDAAGAAEVAERMRVAIEGTAFVGVRERTTISVGAATSQDVDEPSSAWEGLVKAADQFLYQAKHEGRNRVVSGRL